MIPTKQTSLYKTVGACEIYADVYPAGGDTTRPVIVWIHSGALITGNREGIAAQHLERYLGEGFTVVSIDYRLAPETKLPEIIADLQDAFRWLRAQGREQFAIDPDRAAVIGHSAGGYLTLMAGCCVAPRPKALVSFYGYGDIIGDWYSRPDPFYCQQPAVPREEAYADVGGPPLSGVSWSESEGRGRFYLYCRQQGLWPLEVGGHDPAMEPDAFTPFCPVRQVTPEYPPTLLLHGDEDTDVPYEQSVLMAEALERAGVEHELITLSSKGHGFDRQHDDPAVQAAQDRVLAFLHRHLNS
ncbi:MAG TPA: alpha/beta hydrolase [Chthonomonadaceae bacterium]|nr:alpha/beta hydrolase [Chthonomonadaceae bacterium]